MDNLFLLLHFSLHICLLFTTESGQAVTLPSDISALQAFKAAIKPKTIPPWSCVATWNFSTDPCSLPRRTHFICGLTCTADNTRVTSLVLDSAGYSGTLSPLVSKLTQLAILDLSDNYFYGSIPSTISSLSNLQTLSLRSNSFDGELPSSITTLKSLESLDISHNSLTGSLPKNMNSMSSLKRIDLSFNRLAGGLPKLPSNLLELALKSNSLSGYLPKSSFDRLNQLEVIELGENSFTGLLQGWFFLLPSLQQVDLANNSFTRIDILKPAGGNSDLVAVDLGFNRIEGNLPANFTAYPLLSSLSLRYNHLHGPIPWEYGKKDSMRRLYLDGNYLNGKAPEGFFSGGSSVSGSLGNNCLQSCPVTSQLCLPTQKSASACRRAYGGKPRS